MYYSAIALLAMMVLLIENQDIFLNRNGAFAMPAWKTYRRFLLAVLVYYSTDILWGILESRKLSLLLFADTTAFFIASAAGMLFWTQYTVAYLEDSNAFGRFLLYAGRGFAVLVSSLAALNIAVPVLFTVDKYCVYQARGGRYVIFAVQFLLLFLTSAYAFSSYFWRHSTATEKKRYRTLTLFGMIMAVFLFIQLWFPYLPLYTIAYMLGTCLLRSVIIGDEKEEYRSKLADAARIAELKQSITSLLDHMPALSFSKDATTGVYLACNQAFADYTNRKTPEDVIGLTDAQIFDPATASHIAEDDRMALSMEQPYIFYEDVQDASGNPRQLQTTKLKFVDAVGRLCTLGMCQDVTDMVRIQRENSTTKEAYENARSAGIMYSHIAQTLARGYMELYYVNVDTEEYIEYRTDDDSSVLTEARRGWHFFETCEEDAELYVHPDDRDAVLQALDRKTLVKALDRNDTFIMTYRLLEESGQTYVSMKVSRMKDDEHFIIIGISDVDEQMKQRRAAERLKEEQIAYARISALTGDFICFYLVDPESGNYREYSASQQYQALTLPKEGTDFYATSIEKAHNTVYAEDLERFLSLFYKENILAEIEHNGIFALTYRLIIEGKPCYVQLKAAIVAEKAGPRLVVGINNIDSHVRQEEEYARRLAQAQNEASLDVLTGVKNRHAFAKEEKIIELQIAQHCQPQFALVVLDVNDLKKVNDTQGHQAGDLLIQNACKIICDTFKHSPVFRTGGDEFAVIAQGKDYDDIEELVEKMAAHNAEAVPTGGIVIACGMAKFEDDAHISSVYERADQRMYENKMRLKGGRKRYDPLNPQQ